ncbi:MAG: alpha-hydroxy acid oxidase [Candidatus Limnocylindria bacterium]
MGALAHPDRLDPAALARIVAVREFEPLGRERMAPGAADYVAGGAWDERTLAANEAAWTRYRLRPRVLRDVGAVTSATTLLGGPAALPLAIAPMATHGLAHPEAEAATARAAAAAGVPFAVSTMATCSIEDVAGAAPTGTHWFQLYTQADPGRSRVLVERAAAAGYRALLVTVDLPRLGYRERDRRNAFDLPALGNFADDGDGPSHRPDTAGFRRLETVGHTLTWADLASIRSWTGLPLVLKGILTAEDARIALDHGVDGIVVSNHGARQLDRVATAIEALAEISDAVGGRVELLVDGGVRRGLDVLIALAEGASGVLVGKPILWALAAGGEAGVARALEILREETEIALALLGCASPAEVGPEHVERPRTAT